MWLVSEEKGSQKGLFNVIFDLVKKGKVLEGMKEG
jgi:hypothetical protein